MCGLSGIIQSFIVSCEHATGWQSRPDDTRFTVFTPAYTNTTNYNTDCDRLRIGRLVNGSRWIYHPSDIRPIVDRSICSQIEVEVVFRMKM